MSGSSTLLKKTLCYTVGLAVRIFLVTMWTFTKDTPLLEQGRDMALARHAMCESALKGLTLLRSAKQVMSSVLMQRCNHEWSVDSMHAK